MARTAEDVALMLQAVAGPSPLAPLSQTVAGRDFVAAVQDPDYRGLKVAYAADISGVGVDREVAAACRAAADKLDEAGAVVTEVDFSLKEFRQAFQDLRGLWMVGWQYADLQRVHRMGDNLRHNVNYGLSLTATQLGAALRARGQAWHKMRQFFSSHDLLITPCVAVPPFSADINYPTEIGGRPVATYLDWLVATFLVSLTGLPAASVPCGLSDRGLPVGLQIVGPQFGEERVLGMARVVQSLLPIGNAPISVWQRETSRAPSAGRA
jgi:amidase